MKAAFPQINVETKKMLIKEKLFLKIKKIKPKNKQIREKPLTVSNLSPTCFGPIGPLSSNLKQLTRKVYKMQPCIHQQTTDPQKGISYKRLNKELKW